MSEQQQLSQSLTQMQEVLQRVEALSGEIDAIITDPALQNAKLRVTSDLKRIAGFLAGLSGANLTGVDPRAFGPVTEVLGQTINVRSAIAPDDLKPAKSEKEAFIALRDELRSSIVDMADDEVFKFEKQPQGAAVIRSLAKESGIEDYKEAPIDGAFLKAIRDAIIATEAHEEAVAVAEKASEAKAAKPSPKTAKGK